MTPQAEFLRLDETRGVRLQLEYLEAEIELKKHGIRHTVCVFGSTRTQAATAAPSRRAAPRSA